MRAIPSSLAAKFKQLVQADSTKAAPMLDLWISRPVVPLVNDYFLEQQAVQDGASITALDIAVCHPRHRRQSTRIYIAKVENGTAKVLSSPFRQAMEAHIWTDCGFSEPAEDVAIAFDAVMKNDTRGRSEFVTEDLPWVFWVSGGALYGRRLDSDETLTLAKANCTKCTAIRAAGSAGGGFNYGLCLFFLLNGEIYVRQYMDGEWMDAAPVQFGPDGVTWTDIAAFRAWDYRIGVQALGSDGQVYELFTQYMGIGKQTAEHLEIRGASGGSELTRIYYADTQSAEHLDIQAAKNTAPYGGLYELGAVAMLTAYNIDDGAGDWGRLLRLTFDKELDPELVAAQVGQFTIHDSDGNVFYPVSASMDGTGRTMTLTFTSFNNAVGACTAVYTPGTVTTMLEELLPASEIPFVPQHLAPVDGLPEVLQIWNE